MIRLLVVDDSALMRKLLGQIFGAEGDFEIAFARDGVEAMQTIADFRPDVVTLDIQMPNMDGLTCLNRIMLEHPCPVVMLSSLTEEGAQATLEALAIGAVDVIAKPAGAISLGIEELTPQLVEKVRTAATVRLRPSSRLADRLRHGRIAAAKPGRPLFAQRAESGIRLVLIGTSTGGPPALDAVLTQLPADFPAPVIVAQHMPASFTGALARRLDKICALEVSEVSGQTRLEAGHIYIAKGDADIVVSERAGSLVALAAPADENYRWHPSVDRLVTSALKHVPAQAMLGVLMTGMGNDGATAMAQLNADGGYTIAESKETAVVWGMPGELVRLDGASEIRRVEEIGARLVGQVC